MANALAAETSPYLLQHKHNPVDWLPWGTEARELSRKRDVPILLSIGYSACHWCHVMERESFEDATTAAYMNEHFVPIKVDREERPDVDAIYMEAVQSMTGHGGWPMTMFLDPGGVPFYGGTYFPPEPRQGMPSFRMVMEAVVDAWHKQREELAERAPQTAERLGAIARVEPLEGPLSEELLEQAVAGLGAAADRQHGGFGGAPKFPPASAIDFLLARGETATAEHTLDAMCAGGIYDQLAGGFARYAVDAAWMVPHFEKMLYDNAVLARSYVRGYQELGHERYRRVATETLDWALAEMRGPEGGFYSALDADSEGEEGRFYVWEAGEVREVLGEGGLEASEVEAVESYLGVSERGNFEGKNVLHLRDGAASEPPASFERARAALLDVRGKRVRPGLDDKRLSGWNALMIGALAEAGAVLGEPRYVEAAAECADFVFERMRDADGRLLRTFNRDQARLNAYLEDHAYLLEAMVSLYEARFDARDYERAVEVAEAMLDRFADPERGGFFTTSHDHEALIARRKDLDDHPIPSGNSAAALGLVRLGRLSGESRYLDAAEGTLRLLAEPASNHPQALAYALVGIAASIGPAREVAIVSPGGGDAGGEADPERERMLELVRRRYRPGSVLAAAEEGAEVPPLLARRSALDRGTAAYVCREHACRAPVRTAEALAGELS